MLTELQQKLVDALRSGRYAQAQHRLCVVDGSHLSYCCLGLASSLIPGIQQRRTLDAPHRRTIITFDGSTAMLPGSVAEAYGFRSVSGGFMLPRGDDFIYFTMRRDMSAMDENAERDRIDGLDCLVRCNDNGYSFSQIADIIERFPQYIFKQPGEPGAPPPC